METDEHRWPTEQTKGNTEMKSKIVLTVPGLLLVTLLAGLALILLTPSAHAATNWCAVLKSQPAYSYKLKGGGSVYIPSGKRIIASEHPTNGDCKALVLEYRAHHKH